MSELTQSVWRVHKCTSQASGLITQAFSFTHKCSLTRFCRYSLSRSFVTFHQSSCNADLSRAIQSDLEFAQMTQPQRPAAKHHGVACSSATGCSNSSCTEQPALVPPALLTVTTSSSGNKSHIYLKVIHSDILESI